MGRYLSTGANAALFALCCFLIARTANAIFGALLTPPADEPAFEVAAVAQTTRSWSQRQVILTRNLFNSSTLVPALLPEPEPEDEDLEETHLPLFLLGTAASPDPNLAWAAVEDRQNRKTLIVAVGDKLLDKATVLRIDRRRVVLDENGKRRALALDEEEESAAPRKATSRRRGMRSARRPPASDRGPVSVLGENRFSVSRNDVAANLRNPSRLFSQARILPKYDGGQMVGMQVSSIRSGSLLAEIGLADGDVITQLNGIAIDSPEQSQRMMTEISSSDQLKLLVEGTDGSTRTLEFEIPDEE